MKKGPAGVRLCDTTGCYGAWPCDRHGTMRVTSVPVPWPVSTYDRESATSVVGRTRYPEMSVLEAMDDLKCMTCGYSVCSCPKTQMAERLEQTVEREQQIRKALLRALESMKLEERVPEGWEKTDKGYIHQTLPLAVRPRRDGRWQWRVGDDDDRFTSGMRETRDKAMLTAEMVHEQQGAEKKEEEVDPAPLGWMSEECGCCWKGPNDALVNEDGGQYGYAVVLPEGARTSLASSPTYDTLEEACAAAERAAANSRARVQTTWPPQERQVAGASNLSFYTLALSGGTWR